MKVNVWGTVKIGICLTVEVEDPADAIEKAYEEWPGLTNYAGNGGTDKILGTSSEELSLESGDYEPEFDDVEPIK